MAEEIKYPFPKRAELRKQREKALKEKGLNSPFAKIPTTAKPVPVDVNKATTDEIPVVDEVEVISPIPEVLEVDEIDESLNLPEIDEVENIDEISETLDIAPLPEISESLNIDEIDESLNIEEIEEIDEVENIATLPEIEEIGEVTKDKNTIKTILSNKLNLFYIILTVLLVIVFIIFIGARIYSKSQEVTVPDAAAVTRGVVADSCEQFDVLGLDCSVETEFSSLDSGSFISQSVEPGEIINKGEPIVLTYSKGSEVIELPNLSGMTVDEASDTLERLGLVFGGAIDVDDSEIAKGLIISSTIKNGSIVLNGTKVFVNVSSGVAIMPDWNGMTKAEVEIASDKLNISVEFIEEESDSASGIVIAQFPSSGETIRDDIAKITISKPKEVKELTMPDVIGLSEEDAQVKLALEGFKHIKIIEVVNNNVDKVAITDTVPSSGQKVSSEDNVVLIKSKPE